jgi:hypothetical protein
VILGLFDAGERVPRRASQYADILREHRGSHLTACLQDIALPEPYAVAIVDTKTFTGMARYLSVGEGYTVDETTALLYEQLGMCAIDASKMFPDVQFAGHTPDAIVLAGPNPDTVFSCVVDLVKRTTRVMEERENSLPAFGLLKVGIAWHQWDLGVGYRGVEPGLLARRIGDRSGRRPGDMAITWPVLQRLSTEHRGEFSPVEDEQCEQDQVYVRHWNRSMDVPSSTNSNSA